MGCFTQAQICMNGHTITSDVEGSPEMKESFCSQCGSETMEKCKCCDLPIKGTYTDPDYVILDEYRPPSYCSNCGKPYPWTSAKIEALVELAKMEEVLSDKEVEVFSSHVKDISSDTPNTVVSTNKLIIMSKKFSARAWQEIRSLLVDIASETAKKILLNKG